MWIITLGKILGEGALWFLADKGWSAIKDELNKKGHEDIAKLGDILWNSTNLMFGLKAIREAFRKNAGKFTKRALNTLLGAGLISTGVFGIKEVFDERKDEDVIPELLHSDKPEILKIPAFIEEGAGVEFPFVLDTLSEIQDEDLSLEMELIRLAFPELFGEEEEEGAEVGTEEE